MIYIAVKTISKTFRIPNGKTLTIEMKIVNCRIVEITLSGDFFVYPETAIEELENLLKMCSSIECIEKAIDKVLNKATPLGFTWNDLKTILTSLYHEVCGMR